MSYVFPDWPAPINVRSVCTTRLGGVSQAPFDSFNLGDHVGDDPRAVFANRAQLCDELQLPSEPFWLEQVHGTQVLAPGQVRCGDASISCEAGEVLSIMTADCLPVLLCDQAGTVVAGAHAGWRGLCEGVLENTVSAMECDPAEIMVWLGPAIGPNAFEVGDEVREAFVAHAPIAGLAFTLGREAGKWMADIYLLARQRLEAMGITAIYGGEYCTHTQEDLFYSYRRDKTTGRMASLIWMAS
ncbi:peptidoglycan editing factor PgeF [Pokkaliibacter sp. CJK22405]|uniref:peptidoglycan editing factor PgeF n=1 Tax=Pokkaliibacter sp. CJK22405 TaxID=3384615 RepID=UPI00398513C1